MLRTQVLRAQVLRGWGCDKVVVFCTGKNGSYQDIMVNGKYLDVALFLDRHYHWQIKGS